MTKTQRRRIDLKKIWIAGVGSTGVRDTKANDLQAKWNLPEAYLASCWKTMSGDVIL